MKKLVALILALILLLSLVACGGDTGSGTPGENGGNAGNESTAPSQTQPLSPYQVTKEQWEATFFEEEADILAMFSNYTCTDLDRAVIYKRDAEKDLYYRYSMDNESAHFYAPKGDQVDYYSVSPHGSYLFPNENWESHRLNATCGLEYDWVNFGLRHHYDNVMFSESENAYIHDTGSGQVTIYFENGKLVKLALINSRGENKEYTDFGTTEITLPTDYTVRERS